MPGKARCSFDLPTGKAGSTRTGTSSGSRASARFDNAGIDRRIDAAPAGADRAARRRRPAGSPRPLPCRARRIRGSSDPTSGAMSASCASRRAGGRAASSALAILPVGVIGSSSTTLDRQRLEIVGARGDGAASAPSRRRGAVISVTKATGRMPRAGSATPISAAWRTPGCAAQRLLDVARIPGDAIDLDQFGAAAAHS